jgi:Shikimate kinase
MIHRIHILGASGSGTTTLGRALAERLQYPHFDTDDSFWVPTDPPSAVLMGGSCHAGGSTPIRLIGA